MIGLISFTMGCGSKPSKDDSDVHEKMIDVYDGEYFTLSRTLSVTPIVDEDGDEIYEYTNLRSKFLCHGVDINLEINGEIEPIYAVMELIQNEDVVTKDAGNTFYVVFDDGKISKVTTDQNLLSGVKSAKVLEEDILCLRELKQGMEWTSSNGYYSHVDRFEYVVLDNFKRTAPSFKVSTYKNEGDLTPIRVIWWTPELGWCVQVQDYENLTLDVLSDYNFEWEDEDD